MKMDKPKRKGFWSRLAAIICVVVCLNSGIVFADVNEDVSSDIVLNQVKKCVENYYIEDVSEDIISLDSPEEIVEALDDPYTKYMSKEKYDNFINSIDMKMCGIGVYVKMIDEGVLIDSVINNSPAEEVGIKAGDIIVMARSKLLIDMKIDDAVKYIKGPENTSVHIIIRRNDKYIRFNVRRREIKLPSAEGKIIDNNIGYIEIHSFGNDTEKYFNDILKDMENKNVDSYIIDLRYNGGGYMYTARQIAGHFIGNNTCLVVEERNGTKEELKAVNQEIIIDKPVIFLINEYSASASEILSAAVKDYEKAYFIGTKTYGKGVAQLVFELYDGSALKVTNEEFFSPFGNKINKKGIEPDLFIDNVNFLDAARILLSNSSKISDKTDLVKIVDGKWNFKINLNEVKENGLEEVYENIIENFETQNNTELKD